MHHPLWSCDAPVSCITIVCAHAPRLSGPPESPARCSEPDDPFLLACFGAFFLEGWFKSAMISLQCSPIIAGVSPVAGVAVILLIVLLLASFLLSSTFSKRQTSNVSLSVSFFWLVMSLVVVFFSLMCVVLASAYEVSCLLVVFPCPVSQVFTPVAFE